MPTPTHSTSNDSLTIQDKFALSCDVRYNVHDCPEESALRTAHIFVTILVLITIAAAAFILWKRKTRSLTKSLSVGAGGNWRIRGVEAAAAFLIAFGTFKLISESLLLSNAGPFVIRSVLETIATCFLIFSGITYVLYLLATRPATPSLTLPNSAFIEHHSFIFLVTIPMLFLPLIALSALSTINDITRTHLAVELVPSLLAGFTALWYILIGVGFFRAIILQRLPAARKQHTTTAKDQVFYASAVPIRRLHTPMFYLVAGFAIVAIGIPYMVAFTLLGGVKPIEESMLGPQGPDNSTDPNDFSQFTPKSDFLGLAIMVILHNTLVAMAVAVFAAVFVRRRRPRGSHMRNDTMDDWSDASSDDEGITHAGDRSSAMMLMSKRNRQRQSAPYRFNAGVGDEEFEGEESMALAPEEHDYFHPHKQYILNQPPYRPSTYYDVVKRGPSPLAHPRDRTVSTVSSRQSYSTINTASSARLLDAQVPLGERVISPGNSPRTLSPRTSSPNLSASGKYVPYGFGGRRLSNAGASAGAAAGIAAAVAAEEKNKSSKHHSNLSVEVVESPVTPVTPTNIGARGHSVIMDHMEDTRKPLTIRNIADEDNDPHRQDSGDTFISTYPEGDSEDITTLPTVRDKGVHDALAKRASRLPELVHKSSIATQHSTASIEDTDTPGVTPISRANTVATQDSRTFNASVEDAIPEIPSLPRGYEKSIDKEKSPKSSGAPFIGLGFDDEDQSLQEALARIGNDSDTGHLTEREADDADARRVFESLRRST